MSTKNITCSEIVGSFLSVLDIVTVSRLYCVCLTVLEVIPFLAVWTMVRLDSGQLMAAGWSTGGRRMTMTMSPVNVTISQVLVS